MTLFEDQFFNWSDFRPIEKKYSKSVDVKFSKEVYALCVMDPRYLRYDRGEYREKYRLYLQLRIANIFCETTLLTIQNKSFLSYAASGCNRLLV